ncbi:DUF4439 domain-containing protein [Microlunatus flavus]|uniref:DUF4439 domain-containing protein n=1 Tax=Microlunatus flavus TaxID=1036181 RepID=A0A1H9DJN9_9ACTN|nr:DUF4439 domain-containing protein [Microlunatus flavus]SEQ13712.1 protein of unknown function [Microlunatus flavus]
MPVAPHHPGGRWARRDLLRLGLGLGAGVGAAPLLAGCSTSPTVQPPPGGATSARTAPPSASPAPAPTVPAAATAEQSLSALAAAVLAGPHRKDLAGAQRTLLTFLRDAHADHAVALAGDDPSSRPTTSAPSPSAHAPDLRGQSLSASLKRLAQAESRQASAQRRAATTASGLDALLAGSLAVAAETYAAALSASKAPPVGRLRAHRPAPLLTDVAATSQLVAQLHAVVYGYQLAIGKLKYASGARRRAVSELAAARTLLDTEIAFLLSRKADVPAAEPAYAPTAGVRSAGDAIRLVRGMQYRLGPFVGLTLAAAATPKERTAALTQLRSTVRTAGAWGAGLQAWPGWPD